jgi:hypothetical protein
MRMKFRTFVFIAGLFCGSTAFAQDPMGTYFLWQSGQYVATKVHTWASYSAGSDMLTNGFVNKLYLGGYIDDGLKSSVMKRQNRYNIVGATADLGIAGVFRFRKPDVVADGVTEISQKHFMSIRVRDRYRLDGAFGPEAFELAFYGNRPFRGQTVDLSDLKFRFLHWQQVQVQIPLSKTTGIGLSVLKGESFFKGETRKANLFTDPNGYALNVNADFTYQMSDTAKSSFKAWHGTGASLDLYQSFYFGMDQNYILHLAASDIGFIKWSGQSQTFQKDTSFSYTGFTIDDLTNLNDSSFAGLSTDSLLPTAQFKSVTTWLPATLQATFFVYNDGKWNGLVRASLYPNSTARPELKMTAMWKPNKHFRLHTSVAVGGFSRFRIPIETEIAFAKKIYVRGGIDNALAFIVPDKSGGQGAFLSLTYSFERGYSN